MKQGYILVDIGTGNARVGICSTSGEVLTVATCDTRYYKETVFPDSLSFDPERLWADIRQLVGQALRGVPDVEILAITSGSQRQGAVLLDRKGAPLLGMPNLDIRGMEWLGEITDTDAIYRLTGKWVHAVFTASKLRGVKERQRDIWDNTANKTSISDWIGYQFTGELAMELSQACETLLFDAQKGVWSEELCEIFGIPVSWLPEIRKSGSTLGIIKPELAKEFGLPRGTPFIVGGADTQMAVKGTQPALGDIILVSGTTTPIIKLVDRYSIDEQARCWINRYLEPDRFVVETNAGVSGLNYQRMKEILCPDMGYKEIEEEILRIDDPGCVASFGSLIFDEVRVLSRGGFLFDAPVNPGLTRAHFLFAVLIDIACSIKRNFEILRDISGCDTPYVLGCSGGMQGKVLPLLLADMLQKEIVIKDGFIQAGLSGGVMICNETLGIANWNKAVIRSVRPTGSNRYTKLYQKWHTFREGINAQ